MAAIGWRRINGKFCKNSSCGLVLTVGSPEKTASNLGVSRFNLVLERDLDIYLKNKAKKNKTSKTQEIKNLILNDIQTRKD